MLRSLLALKRPSGKAIETQPRGPPKKYPQFSIIIDKLHLGTGRQIDELPSVDKPKRARPSQAPMMHEDSQPEPLPLENDEVQEVAIVKQEVPVVDLHSDASSDDGLEDIEAKILRSNNPSIPASSTRLTAEDFANLVGKKKKIVAPTANDYLNFGKKKDALVEVPLVAVPLDDVVEAKRRRLRGKTTPSQLLGAKPCAKVAAKAKAAARPPTAAEISDFIVVSNLNPPQFKVKSQK